MADIAFSVSKSLRVCSPMKRDDKKEASSFDCKSNDACLTAGHPGTSFQVRTFVCVGLKLCCVVFDALLVR